MKNQIKIKELGRGNGTVAFKITECPDDIYHENGNFDASNGITITSDERPDFDGSYLYLWGYKDTFNDDMILVSEKEFDEILEAIEEYNKSKEPKIYVFLYDGGSVNHYRRVKVSSEDSRYIKGEDLDDDGKFKNFLKSKIKGEIFVEKE